MPLWVTKDKVWAFCKGLVLCCLLMLGFLKALPLGATQHSPYISDLSKQLHSQLELSKEENEWLVSHPVIKVGVDSGYAPYSFLDPEGQYTGVAVDYLSLLSEVLGIRFEIVEGLSWSEIISGAKSRSLDVVATAVITPEREEFLEFSQIYLPTPLVIMTRTEGSLITSAEHLTGKRIALVEGYSSSERVMNEYPGIKTTMVATPYEGLSLLSTGKVDAYVGVLGVNFYLTRKYGFTNLKIASRYDTTANGQRFAVRKDWKIFRGIVNKALNLMSLRDHNQLMRNWIPIDLTGLALDYTASPPLVLSAEERQWLSDHSEISIGAMNAWPPMDYIDTEGNAVGIGAKFIEALNRRLEGRLNIVSGEWSGIYKSVQDKKLDALIGITPRENREPFFNFTKPYLTVPHVIFARRGTEYLSDLSALNGKTIALEKGFFLKEVILQNYPLINVTEYPSTSTALGAVVKGSADAYIGNRAVAMYVIHNELISNLEEHGRIRDSASINAIGVRKDQPILRNVLQKALDNITVKERLAILQDWVEPSPLGNIQSIELTIDEWDWLDKHPVIKVAGQPNWLPVEFKDKDGQYKGIAPEYLDLMSGLLGVRFEYNQNGSSQRELLEKKQVDIVSASTRTDSQINGWQFSESYLTLPAMIFTRDHIAFVSGLQDLQGKKVATVSGRGITQRLQKESVGLDLIEFDTAESALTALQNRDVDAYVGSILMTSPLLRRLGYSNIHVSGQTPFLIDLGVSYRDDWPELGKILNKAISQISEAQKANIAAQWIGVKIKEAPDYTRYWQLLFVALIIIAAFIIWNRYLQRLNAEKSQEIRQQNLSLLKSQKGLAEAQRVAHLGSWSWDLNSNLFSWSDELYRLMNIDRTRDVGFDEFIMAIHPSDREFVEEILRYSRDNKEAVQFQHRTLLPDGTICHFEQHTDVSHESPGGDYSLTGTVLDISARKKAEQEIQKLSHAFENSPISIAITDNVGILEYVNPYFTAMTGYTFDEVHGKAVEIIPGTKGQSEADISSDLWEAINSGKVWRGESHSTRKSGEHYWESITVAPVLNDAGEFTNILILKQDITQQKEIKSQLFKKTNFSDLTKQPNREFILAQSDLKLQEKVPVAFMLIDMLNVKRINDTLGMRAGDEIISQAAERLDTFVSPTLTVAHLGGGEFLILVESPRKTLIEHMVQRLNAEFKKVFLIGGQSVHQPISVGISLYPEDAQSSQQLLSNAHTAVTHAKRNGSFSHAYYSERYSQDAQNSLYIESLLLQAIPKNELQVYFQPKVDSLGNFRGAEALVRWFNEELGTISPGRFIPIAEQSDIILDLGRWVIEQSCAYASEWREEVGEGYSVSINLSPKQFYEEGIVDFIAQCIERYGLKGPQVEIEVTEGLFMEGEEFIREQIVALKSLGVSLAMDDFGTGYSSLQYLRSYPFDTLKIDRSFVMELPDSGGDANLVRAIIKMGKALGLRTVAEGVESIDQADFLRREGCDLIQGFLFAKPMPADELVEWLRMNQVRIS